MEDEWEEVGTVKSQKSSNDGWEEVGITNDLKKKEETEPLDSYSGESSTDGGMDSGVQKQSSSGVLRDETSPVSSDGEDKTILTTPEEYRESEAAQRQATKMVQEEARLAKDDELKSLETQYANESQKEISSNEDITSLTNALLEKHKAEFNALPPSQKTPESAKEATDAYNKDLESDPQINQLKGEIVKGNQSKYQEDAQKVTDTYYGTDKIKAADEEVSNLLDAISKTQSTEESAKLNVGLLKVEAERLKLKSDRLDKAARDKGYAYKLEDGSEVSRSDYMKHLRSYDFEKGEGGSNTTDPDMALFQSKQEQAKDNDYFLRDINSNILRVVRNTGNAPAFIGEGYERLLESGYSALGMSESAATAKKAADGFKKMQETDWSAFENLENLYEDKFQRDYDLIDVYSEGGALAFAGAMTKAAFDQLPNTVAIATASATTGGLGGMAYMASMTAAGERKDYIADEKDKRAQASRLEKEGKYEESLRVLDSVASDQSAVFASAAKGIVEAGTEQIQLNVMGSQLKNLSKSAARATAIATEKGLGTVAVKEIQQEFTKLGLKTLNNTVQEASGEFLAGYSQKFIDDISKGLPFDQDAALREGSIGALTSLPMTLAPASANVVVNSRAYLSAKKQSNRELNEKILEGINEQSEEGELSSTLEKQANKVKSDMLKDEIEQVELNDKAIPQQRKELADVTEEINDIDNSLQEVSGETAIALEGKKEELVSVKDGVISDIEKNEEGDVVQEKETFTKREQAEKVNTIQESKPVSEQKTDKVKPAVYNESIDGIKEVKPPTKKEVALKEKISEQKKVFKAKFDEYAKSTKEEFKGKLKELKGNKKETVKYINNYLKQFKDNKYTPTQLKSALKQLGEADTDIQLQQATKKILDMVDKKTEATEAQKRTETISNIKQTLAKDTDRVSKQAKTFIVAKEAIENKKARIVNIKESLKAKGLTDLEIKQQELKLEKAESDLGKAETKIAVRNEALAEDIDNSNASDSEIDEFLISQYFGDVLNMSQDKLDEMLSTLKEKVKAQREELKAKKAKEKSDIDAKIEEITKKTKTKKSLFGLREKANKLLKSQKKVGSEKVKKKGLEGVMQSVRESFDSKGQQFMGGLWNMKKLIADMDRGGVIEKHIINPLIKAVETQAQGMESAMSSFNKAVGKAGFSDMEAFGKAVSKMDNFSYNSTTEKAKINVSPESALRNYAWSKDDKLRTELESEGISIDELEKAIPKKIRDGVDSIIDFLSNEYGKGINEVYKDKYGIELKMLENYFPVERQNASVQEVSSEGSFRTPANPYASSTKERSQSKRPLATSSARTDFFSAINKHITEGERYKAYTPIMKSINNILNSNTVKLMTENLGSRKLLMDAVESQVNPKSKENTEKIIEKTVRFGYLMALSGKPIMALKQASSFFLAPLTHKRGVRNWLATVVKAAVKGDINYAKFKGVSASLRARHKMTLDELESGQAGLGLKTIGVTERVGSAPIKVGDMIGLSGHYVSYLSDLYEGVNEEDALHAFNKDYNSIQQAGTEYRMFKSGFQNSEKHLVGLTAMYLSSPIQFINNATVAAKQIWRGEDVWSNSKKLAANLVISQAAFNLFSATGLILSGYLTGDEDEVKDGMEDVVRSLLLLKTIESIPLIGAEINHNAIRPLVVSAEGLVNDMMGDKYLDEQYKTYDKSTIFTSMLRWFKPLTDAAGKKLEGKELSDEDQRKLIIRALSIGSALGLRINPEHIMLGIADAMDKVGDNASANEFLESMQILIGLPKSKIGKFASGEKDSDTTPARVRKTVRRVSRTR